MTLQSEIILSSTSRFPLKVNRCWSGMVPSVTCILLLMLSTVSDFSASTVIVLPAVHEYRESRSALHYHGYGECTECMMSDCFRYRTQLDLEPTQSRWNESSDKTLCPRCLSTSGEQVKKRSGHRGFRSVLYPERVRAVFSHSSSDLAIDCKVFHVEVYPSTYSTANWVPRPRAVSH